MRGVTQCIFITKAIVIYCKQDNFQIACGFAVDTQNTFLSPLSLDLFLSGTSEDMKMKKI